MTKAFPALNDEASIANTLRMRHLSEVLSVCLWGLSRWKVKVLALFLKNSFGKIPSWRTSPFSKKKKKGLWAHNGQNNYSHSARGHPADRHKVLTYLEMLPERYQGTHEFSLKDTGSWSQKVPDAVVACRRAVSPSANWKTNERDDTIKSTLSIPKPCSNNDVIANNM